MNARKELGYEIQGYKDGVRKPVVSITVDNALALWDLILAGEEWLKTNMACEGEEYLDEECEPEFFKLVETLRGVLYNEQG